jgi:Cu(I)/Ag(I) efflux system protein CusF
LIAALAAALSTAAMAVPALAHNGEDHGAAPQSASGEGVIKAVDIKAGTVVIAHGPIPALKWPAMTMKFRSSPPPF